jgi:hypothetical protein
MCAVHVCAVHIFAHQQQLQWQKQQEQQQHDMHVIHPFTQPSDLKTH